MRKSITKIICSAVAVVATLGTSMAFTACSGTKPVSMDKSGNVASNGGFAVTTGDYVYFINGQARSSTDENKNIVRGAIMRISRKDFADHNYATVEAITDTMAYSASTNGGLYVYGDSIYYATPSTDRNSSGSVLNTRLAFTKTKLDATSTKTIYTLADSTMATEYRFVEVEGKVYALYVLKEKLYGDTEATNLHSVDCETGKDTILAYNVTDYTFDAVDAYIAGEKVAPNVYYTMAVASNLGTANQQAMNGYNQLYSVAVNQQEDKKLGVNYFIDQTKEDAEEEIPVYINYGTCVLDGIGANDLQLKTELTTLPDGVTVAHSGYTYDIQSYKDGKLYFTIADAGVGTTMLYRSDLAGFSNAVTNNELLGKPFFINSANFSSYDFIEIDGANDMDMVMIQDGKLIRTGVADGKMITGSYQLTSASQILKVDKATTTVYFENNGTIGRINYAGTNANYNMLPDELTDNSEYEAQKVLDIAYDTAWYAPEFIDGQIMFSSETDSMGDYNYIMAVDLRTSAGKEMTAKELKDYSESYQDVLDAISNVDKIESTDGSKTYQYLSKALTYSFMSGDGEYVTELMDLGVTNQKWKREHNFSEVSEKIYKDFANNTNNAKAKDIDWTTAEFATKRKVNGEDVASNKRDYYYSVVGKMTEEDKEAYNEALKASLDSAIDYPDEPEQVKWWDTLTTTGKVLFIVGMSILGACVVAAAVLVPIFVIRKKKKEAAMADYKKPKIYVDTTDDKDVNVYED